MLSTETNLEYYCDYKRHLVCVPYSAENLHKMAADLKIGTNWLHKGKFLHYDIPIRMMNEVTKRCTVVSSKKILQIIKKS